MVLRAAARSSSRPQNRVASRLSPLPIGNQPSLASVRRMVAGGWSSSSRLPSSMNERSAARASSASSPTKQLPGSIEGDERARRHVEALERAGPVAPQLVDQPVLGVRAEQVLGGEHRSSVAGGVQHPRPDVLVR